MSYRLHKPTTYRIWSILAPLVSSPTEKTKPESMNPCHILPNRSIPTMKRRLWPSGMYCRLTGMAAWPQLLYALPGSLGMSPCFLRCSFSSLLCSPGDKLAVPGLMTLLTTNRTNVQFGDNKNLFDWTYIENAAHAHILAAQRLSPDHPKFSQVAGQAFFITNGEPIPYWNFSRSLWKAVGHVPSQTTVIPRPVGILIAIIMELISWFTGKPATLTRFRIMIFYTTRWCSIDKARKALDYEPPVPLQEGIRRAAEVRIFSIRYSIVDKRLLQYWQTNQAPPEFRTTKE